MVNADDMNATVNMALGKVAVTADLEDDGQCTIVDVQGVIIAASGGDRPRGRASSKGALL